MESIIGIVRFVCRVVVHMVMRNKDMFFAPGELLSTTLRNEKYGVFVCLFVCLHTPRPEI